MGQVHCIFWERIKKKKKENAREQEMCMMMLSEYSLIVVNVYESNDIFNE